MSVEQISATLQTAMTEVLESMCFILPGEPVDMAAFAGEPWMEHTLTFHGPEEGRFGIRAPRPVAVRIASDFLGEDPVDLSEQQVGEVMNELANMVCGNVLGHCYHDHAFALTSPTVMHPVSQEQGAQFDWEEGVLVAWVKTY
jgi:CheY-specific phosphatase CheX